MTETPWVVTQVEALQPSGGLLGLFRAARLGVNFITHVLHILAHIHNQIQWALCLRTAPPARQVEECKGSL